MKVHSEVFAQNTIVLDRTETRTNVIIAFVPNAKGYDPIPVMCAVCSTCMKLFSFKVHGTWLCKERKHEYVHPQGPYVSSVLHIPDGVSMDTRFTASEWVASWTGHAAEDVTVCMT